MKNKKNKRKRTGKERLIYFLLIFGLGFIIGGILIADSEPIYIPIICIYTGLIMFYFGTFELATLASREKRVIITKNLIVVRDNKNKDLCHIPKQSDFDELYEIIKERKEIDDNAQM